jgi:hypothetical protein
MQRTLERKKSLDVNESPGPLSIITGSPGLTLVCLIIPPSTRSNMNVTVRLYIVDDSDHNSDVVWRTNTDLCESRSCSVLTVNGVPVSTEEVDARVIPLGLGLVTPLYA